MAKHVRLGNLKGARLLVMAVVVLTGLSVTGLALANQGDPDKVLTVDNPNVSCASPMEGPKVEGDLGTTISFSAGGPLDFVTGKSGGGAGGVSATFDTTTGATTTTVKPTTTTGATTTTVKPTTTTGATSTSGATTTTAKPTTTTGATTTTVKPTTTSGATSTPEATT